MTQKSTDQSAETGGVEAQVGRRIAALREARGWSQGELADRLTAAGLRLDRVLVYRTEAGRRPLRINEAAMFAATLGASLGDLLGVPVQPDRQAALLATIDTSQQLAEAVEAAQQAQQRYDEAQQALDRAMRELREANRRRTDALVAFELASTRYNSLPPEKG